jgi:hypothetical protein
MAVLNKIMRRPSPILVASTGGLYLLQLRCEIGTGLVPLTNRTKRTQRPSNDGDRFLNSARPTLREATTPRTHLKASLLITWFAQRLIYRRT